MNDKGKEKVPTFEEVAANNNVADDTAPSGDPETGETSPEASVAALEAELA